MKSQYIPLLAFSLLLGLFLISNASAQVLVNPATGATLTGTNIWNVTNSTGGFNTMLNCTLYGKSVSTANSSYIPLSVATNVSAAAQLSMVNGTFNSLSLEDSNDYTFFASCLNQSSINQNTSINTGIIVNNGVPTAPVLSPVTNSQITVKSTTQTFTGTVVDSNTTSCTYAIGRGGISASSQDTTSGAASYSGSSCTFSKTFSTSSDNGVWNWVITASDGTDTANSQAVLNVQIPAAGGGAGNSGVNLAGTSSSNIWGWVIGIAIAAIVIFFIARKK